MIYKVEETEDGKLYVNDTVVFDFLDNGEIEVTYDSAILTENEVKEISDELISIIEKSLEMLK